MTRSKLLFGILCVAAVIFIIIPGCDELTTEVIEVTKYILLADFTAYPETGCSPLTVKFDDISAGDIVERIWIFGDGPDTVTTEEDTISHVYSEGGIFDVTLTVVDTAGETETEIKKRFVIVDRAIADFTVDSITGCLPLTVQFRNSHFRSNTYWKWYFDYGNSESDTSRVPSPYHTYDTAGVYSIALLVRNDSCVSETDTIVDTMIWIDSIVVRDCPVAGFYADKDTCCPPCTVQFTDTSTGIFDAWSWDFGDDSTDTVQNPLHIYDTAGLFTVSLTLSGNEGSNTMIRENLIVVPAIPDAYFIADTTDGCSTLTVQFTDQSTGSIDNWLWYFGDGDSSLEQEPSHEYSNTSGSIVSYEVILIASGYCGVDTFVKPDYVIISSGLPVANFTVDIDSGAAPLFVQFTDNSSNVLQWLWNFGDGDSTLLHSGPTHTYQSPGRYGAMLIVENDCGSDTLTDSIIVTETKEGGK